MQKASSADGLRILKPGTVNSLRGKPHSAPRLTLLESWCWILGYALRKCFRGRVPKPPPRLPPVWNSRPGPS